MGCLSGVYDGIFWEGESGRRWIVGAAMAVGGK